MAILKTELPDRIKRGISNILESPKFTTAFKADISGFRDSSTGYTYNESKDGILTISDANLVVSTADGTSDKLVVSKKPHSVIGWVERPKYIESELEKSIDIVIDELITPATHQNIDVVPRPVYDELNKLYENEVLLHNDFYNKWISDESIIIGLNSDILLLKQQLDNERLMTAAAENESAVVNKRYSKLLNDFQIVLQKGIKEGIARVSLEAQVAGLRAQLESLKVIIEQLKNQISGNIADNTAAGLGLSPSAQSNFYYKFKLKDANVSTDGIDWTTSRDHPTDTYFADLEIQNLRGDNVDIETIKIALTGDLLSYGPFGFTNSVLPDSIINKKIIQGSKSSINFYASSNIGGKGYDKPKPNKKPFGSNAKDYNGGIVITVIWKDGFTDVTETLPWHIRKNRG